MIKKKENNAPITLLLFFAKIKLVFKKIMLFSAYLVLKVLTKLKYIVCNTLFKQRIKQQQNIRDYFTQKYRPFIENTSKIRTLDEDLCMAKEAHVI